MITIVIVQLWCISWLLIKLYVNDGGILREMFSVVNGLFPSLTFIGLIYTLWQQRKELGDTEHYRRKEAIEKQYYKLFDLLKENIKVALHDKETLGSHSIKTYINTVSQKDNLLFNLLMEIKPNNLQVEKDDFKLRIEVSRIFWSMLVDNFNLREYNSCSKHIQLIFKLYQLDFNEKVQVQLQKFVAAYEDNMSFLRNNQLVSEDYDSEERIFFNLLKFTESTDSQFIGKINLFLCWDHQTIWKLIVQIKDLVKYVDGQESISFKDKYQILETLPMILPNELLTGMVYHATTELEPIIELDHRTVASDKLSQTIVINQSILTKYNIIRKILPESETKERLKITFPYLLFDFCNHEEALSIKQKRRDELEPFWKKSEID